MCVCVCAHACTHKNDFYLETLIMTLTEVKIISTRKNTHATIKQMQYRHLTFYLFQMIQSS